MSELADLRAGACEGEAQIGRAETEAKAPCAVPFRLVGQGLVRPLYRTANLFASGRLNSTLRQEG